MLYREHILSRKERGTIMWLKKGGLMLNIDQATKINAFCTRALELRLAEGLYEIISLDDGQDAYELADSIAGAMRRGDEVYEIRPIERR